MTRPGGRREEIHHSSPVIHMSGRRDQDQRTSAHEWRRHIMKATLRGHAIAESDRAQEVGGYCYFPRETVRMDLLRAAPKTARDRECPHGVQFYDIILE